MTRARTVALIAGLLMLLLGGRMILRYLDWQESELQRAEAVRP